MDPMGLFPFHALFPDEAKHEYRTVIPVDDDDLPSRPFTFAECYCVDPECDCRRTLLQVLDVEARKQVATISYAFEPPASPYDDEAQVFLDPLNLQSPLANGLFSLFRQMVREDPEYHARLVRHYTMWKQITNDPQSPARANLLARAQSSQRASPKARPNEPCPCGSGQKYKKCCRDHDNTPRLSSRP